MTCQHLCLASEAPIMYGLVAEALLFLIPLVAIRREGFNQPLAVLFVNPKSWHDPSDRTNPVRQVQLFPDSKVKTEFAGLLQS